MWYDDVYFGAEDESAPASWSSTRRAAEELRLVSGVHSKVAPEQRLITLAYNRQLISDRKAHFDPNVDVLFCPRERCQIHPLDGCDCNREYLELLKRWVDWLGPQRMLYLDYSLDHYIRVSTWGAHPSGDVLAADMRMLAKIGLQAVHTLYFSDYSDVECALVTYSLMHAVARPNQCDPARLRDEYFRIAFGQHASVARDLFDLYSPIQAAFLRYDDYRGVPKRDMRFAGLEQTQPSLQHAKLLTEALRTHGPKLGEALRSVTPSSTETPVGRELYRIVRNMGFSLRQFSLAAAMLDGVPYIRGAIQRRRPRPRWLRARAELVQLKPEVQGMECRSVCPWHLVARRLAGWSTYGTAVCNSAK